jgi:hypothetical protein
MDKRAAFGQPVLFIYSMDYGRMPPPRRLDGRRKPNHHPWKEDIHALAPIQHRVWHPLIHGQPGPTKPGSAGSRHRSHARSHAWGQGKAPALVPGHGRGPGAPARVRASVAREYGVTSPLVPDQGTAFATIGQDETHPIQPRHQARTRRRVSTLSRASNPCSRGFHAACRLQSRGPLLPWMRE